MSGTYPVPVPVPDTQPRRWVTLLLAAVGGVVTDAAFPQRGYWFAAVVGLALLALALRRDSARWAFLVGTTWGLSFFLVHIWWANESVGWVPWLGLSSVEALMVGGFGATWVWIRRWPTVGRHLPLATASFAVAWVAWEELRSIAPFAGFPWGRIAFSQTEGPMLRFASLGGTVLVSGLVAALGLLLTAALLAARRGRLALGVAALAVVAAVPLLGLMVPLDTRAETGAARVGVVQGNVAEPGLGAFENAREVIGNHAAGTLALAQSEAGALDVVLWPENAADYNPRTDQEAGDAVEAAAQAIGAPILLGTQSYLRDDAGTVTGRFNDYIRWDPGVGAVDVYAKQHPAPFAEYIPYRTFFRNFSDAVDLVTVDMVAGTETGVMPVPVDGRGVLFGVAICFEVAYDPLVRDSVLAGAEVLVVPTNNASFGVTAESEQQLAMSIFRAVEHGRATVQISTVGVSGIITPNGVVTERTELFTADQMVADLSLRTSFTLATRLGMWPTFLTYAGAIAAAAMGMISHARARRRGNERTTARSTSSREEVVV